MSLTCIDRELETPAAKMELRAPAPEPPPKEIGWEQRVGNLLVTIFQGHEEFLGWTPD